VRISLDTKNEPLETNKTYGVDFQNDVRETNSAIGSSVAIAVEKKWP